MILHLTDRLRKKLHEPILTEVEEKTGKHLRWYANVFAVGKTEYIVTANATSLFSVVLYGEDITDADDYIRRFLGGLEEHLEALEMRLLYERVIAPATAAFTLAKPTDSWVLALLNSLVGSCKHLLRLQDLSPFELTQALNSRPLKSLGFYFPQEVFARMDLA